MISRDNDPNNASETMEMTGQTTLEQDFHASDLGTDDAAEELVVVDSANPTSPTLHHRLRRVAPMPPLRVLPSLEMAVYGCEEAKEEKVEENLHDSLVLHPDEGSLSASERSEAIVEQEEEKQPHPMVHLNLTMVRQIATRGLPSEGSYGRALVWRVLWRGQVVDNASSWTQDWHQQRAAYLAHVAAWFGPSACEEVQQGLILCGGRRSRRKLRNSMIHHHASNQTVTSNIPRSIQEAWKKLGNDLPMLERLARGCNALRIPGDEEDKEGASFFNSAVLLDQVRKDVTRTHPDLSFYLQAQLGPRRRAALERILFCWAKEQQHQNGGGYVQGMNEIVSTIYYVLANDEDCYWAAHAEADTYWMLRALLFRLQDVFIPQLDASETGIQGRIQNMQLLLARHDPEVHEHLEDYGIDPSFYAVRWWTTLLSREFLLPDTIRLWDTMFASTHPDNFLRYLCVTMVMLIRQDLLTGDFTQCLRLLQSYPSVNVEFLLESCRSLWIYDTQIATVCHHCGVRLHQALSHVAPPASVIMAFGRGRNNDDDECSDDNSPTRLRSEHLELAGDRVRDATTAVGKSAQNFLGRAKGLYRRYAEKKPSEDGSGDNPEDKKQSDVSSSDVSDDDDAEDDPILAAAHAIRQNRSVDGATGLVVPSTGAEGSMTLNDEKPPSRRALASDDLYMDIFMQQS
jgi:Rab-GTPase-TBC domain